MQWCGADTLSYKDFDPSFVDSELAARIAIIEKEKKSKTFRKNVLNTFLSLN
jgi:elongation factor Ts